MAILKIARMGHPVLKRVARPIDDPGAPEVRRLVNDMLDTLEDAGGTGLAAPQVHVPRRLVLFYVSSERAQRENKRENGREDGEDGEDGEDAPDEVEEVPLTVLVNPTIEPLTEEMVVSWEACLSLPDLAGRVPRYKAVRYRGLDLRGEEIVREARGFHARVVQHECDHLDGVLYPQRMTDLSTLTFASELKARAGIEVAKE
ncbi:MAG: peptide deformylase [Proteobacteria bacterium]|nr:peptide deformylase [Pseudomonadota bacterium]